VLKGQLIAPRDPPALAHAIRTCRLDPGARKHVEQNFDIRKVIPRIEDFYSR
jgi:hypothetical protein